MIVLEYLLYIAIIAVGLKLSLDGDILGGLCGLGLALLGLGGILIKMGVMA
jgi:hypothetical protein